MRNSAAKAVALGGVLAALALVIMCLGGLIPVATYVIPMLCGLLGYTVLRFCGGRIFWAWYGAVALLGMLMCPDKEAASVFLFLGWYPYVKPHLDRTRLKAVWKLLLFNSCIVFIYAFVMFILGLQSLLTEYQELGILGLLVMVLLGNITFFLFDNLLKRLSERK